MKVLKSAKKEEERKLLESKAIEDLTKDIVTKRVTIRLLIKEMKC